MVVENYKITRGGGGTHMGARQVPVDRPPFLIAPIPNDPPFFRTDTY